MTLGLLGKDLTIADGFSVTNNQRGSAGVTPGSHVPPHGAGASSVKYHTAKSSKGFARGQSSTSSQGHHNTSRKARSAAGPSLAKAFFPEKSKCQCCKGYIYGCDEQVCYELGKCICSLEEGEGTGSVKKKKGKYEFLVIKNMKRKRGKTTDSKLSAKFKVVDDEVEELSGGQKGE